jgi:hypothetical protein
MRRIPFTLLAVWLLAAAPSGPALPPGAQTSLTRYLDALQAGRYSDAYALLTQGERAYFKTGANFASVFTADRFQLDRYALHAVRPVDTGLVVVVGEKVQFLDQAHGETIGANVTAAYGLTSEGGVYHVADEARAWKAFDPIGADATQERLEAAVRKVSFYPGRVSLLVTFINRGDSFVTLLPYGRTTLLDESGAPYPLIETKIPELTDRELRLGLRLAGSAEYTGALTFAMPSGAGPPKAFVLTVGPMLRDGADDPFTLQLGTIAVPPG